MAVVILLLGPPQSGKTTQGERLFAALGLPQIIFSDVLREAVKSGSTDGIKAKSSLSTGEAVPDDVMTSIIASKVSGEIYSKGFTLEGFPLTAAQARNLQNAFSKRGLKIDYAIFLDVDNPQYESESEQLLSYFQGLRILYRINGNAFVEDVANEILSIVNQPNQNPQAPEVSRGAPTDIPSDGFAVRWLDPRRSETLRLCAPHPGPPGTEHARQYASNLRLREDLRKHDRLKVSPEQRFEEPVTAAMEYGWRASRPELYKRDPQLFHPRMKSSETAYAEALILGPRHC
uniref:Adenylate kinase n=1 Tax=Cryptomonas curvata TaxID=233186 RepID=A0A7S0LW74_9CRYP|mmetsp:Transcript_13446/g.28673  ORF Transcript_13446/g.28673 Transcript_13446/m.28673 type:complete len:289 (+) Transcript_13446:3-869(+)